MQCLKNEYLSQRSVVAEFRSCLLSHLALQYTDTAISQEPWRRLRFSHHTCHLQAQIQYRQMLIAAIHKPLICL